jgi:DNA repair protein RecN (Recombination protein N)
MLSWIRVRNIAVIDELEVDFEKGLNLLTGETGTGKSILVDAFGLVLGSRATADLVRSGAEVAQVEAVFHFASLPKGLVRRLDDAGIESHDEELVIRREISVAGRGKVAVNGYAGAISLLRDLAPYLADIHGQGENLSLLRPGAELELLDRLGGNAQKRNEVGESYRRLLKLDRELGELEREARDKKARLELIEFQLSEIDKAGARLGEDQELEEEKKLLVHEERLRGAAEEAYAVLYEEETSVLARLAQVWKRVSELAEIDSRMAPFMNSRSSVTSQLEDLALFLRDYRERIRFTPGRLDEVEDRLALLERLKKKYGGSLATVLAHQEECKVALDRLENEEEHLSRIKSEIDKTVAEYLNAAGALSKLRTNTAQKLQKRVQAELRSLAMEKARFSIEVSRAVDSEESRAGWKETGLDDAALLFSANPGEDLRLLSRIASGGESSRFMLALKSVATEGEQSKTLVFDEVDTGIEGRVADIVGEKLKQLSRTHQVICITHLPQIASSADVHYRIEKTVTRGRTITGIERLDHSGRIQEIARMLAGAAVTESALRHAEQLVSDKRTSKV